MKTFTAIALALIVGAGVGYGVFNYMGDKAPEATPAVEAAQAVATEATEPAKIEPSAEEKAPEKVHGADDPVVAKVDGENVYKTDVLDFIKTLPAQMQQVDVKTIFPMALEQVVSAKIVDVKAAAENLASDAEYVKRLADAKIQIARAIYVEKEIEKSFTADSVQKAYDEIVKNIPKTEEVHARHILVDSEAKAKDVISKLAGGAKFEDLAKEFSTDKSNSATGGDLGYFAKTDMVKEFSEAAFALKANEYTKAPVKTQFGFHVIQSLDKRERPAPKFEDVKMQLEGQVKRDLLNKLVEQWKSSAKVEKFDMDGKPVAEVTPEAAPAAAPEAAPAEATPAPAEEKKAE